MYVTLHFSCVFLSSSFLSAIGSDKKCNGVPGLCDLKFNEVTLPATHKSGAYGLTSSDFGEVTPYTNIRKSLAISQTLTFREQLEAGIRAVDIEPCCTDGESARKVNCGGAKNEKLDSQLLSLLSNLRQDPPPP